jgi:hypothetical protein
MKKLCPGQEGREAFMCLRENTAKASAACQAALSKMPSRGGGQGGGGQGGGAPAGAPAAAAPGAPAAGGSGGGAGGFTPTPEMMAAREAMKKACAADNAKVCPGLEGRELFMCIRQNEDKLSGGCKAAIAKMPRRPQPAGG